MAEVKKDAEVSRPQDDVAVIEEAESIVADAEAAATASNSDAEAAATASNSDAEAAATASKAEEPAKATAVDAEVEVEVVETDNSAAIADAAMASAAEQLKNYAEQLKAAKSEAAEWQDKYLRLHAEWDTYRRRTNEQREAERARACEKLVESLLPVIDDFERTIDYATKNGEAELLTGVEAVHSKFVGVLEKSGVAVINPVGEAYNALEAQAVATVEKPEVFDETVDQVYQKGYKMGTKILREAMVTVTTGGPKRPPQEEK